MATFVLAHGGWHGAWCWDPILPGLRDAGHDVRAVDLPGHGDDRAPLSEMTREAYVRRIAEAVQSAAGPAVLVGHSMSGTLITQVAELHPDRVAALVYVAAFIPRTGEVMTQIVELVGTESLILSSFEVDEAAGTLTLKPGRARPLFYELCDPQVAEQAESRLRPENPTVMGGEVTITEERAGSVPRYIVECLHDQAFPLAAQREMQRLFPALEVFSLDADHSPFYSATDDLVRCLVSVADQVPCDQKKIHA
jgi:pimeloyl-ACP methyl ester carboxylesterase